MDKVKFLQREYERIVASGAFVTEAWHVSEERFVADLLDRTPNYCSGRFLAPKDKTLGYSWDNVEWHFERSARLKAKTAKKKPAKPKKVILRKTRPEKPTSQDVRAKAVAEREARRQALVDEFRRWEQRYRS
jgi:hypothetical protein